VSYTFVVSLTDSYEILFNVNENNIIDDVNEMDVNTYIRLGGHEATIEVKMPYLHYNPTHSHITYKIKSRHMENPRMELVLSPNHPLTDLLGQESHQFLSFGSLSMVGSYRYYYSYKNQYRDAHTIDIRIKACDLFCYGHVIRYMFALKNNYFGPHVCVVTADEYAQQPLNYRNIKKKLKVSRVYEQRVQQSNAFETFLTVSVENVTLNLPANLFKSPEQMDANQPHAKFYSLQLELRNVAQYSNLNLSLSPVVIHIPHKRDAENANKAKVNSYLNWNAKETYLRLNDLTYSTHESCGEAPACLTYRGTQVLSIGDMTGQMFPDQVLSLITCFNNFNVQYADAADLTCPSLSDRSMTHGATQRNRTRGPRDDRELALGLSPYASKKELENSTPDLSFELDIGQARINLLHGSTAREQQPQTRLLSAQPASTLSFTRVELSHGLQLQTSTAVTPSADSTLVCRIATVELAHMTSLGELKQSQLEWKCVARVALGVTITKGEQRSGPSFSFERRNAHILPQAPTYSPPLRLAGSQRAAARLHIQPDGQPARKHDQQVLA
jgi:hypothetical protein